MRSSVQFLLLGLGLAVALKFVSHLVKQRRLAAKARALGCEPPPMAPGGGILGTKMLRRIMKADKDWLLPDFFTQRYGELTEAFGRPAATFRFNLLGEEIYHTTDPKNIQAILATQFEDFGLADLRGPTFIPLLGNGIFVQDGKSWEHSRAMIRPNFARDQVSDLNLEEKHVQHLLRAMPVLQDGWTEELNIQTLFFRLTIDSATEFLFGKSVDSQIAELPENRNTSDSKESTDDFAWAFDNGQRHVAARIRLANFYWLHNPKEFRQSCKTCEEFVDHYVQLALQSTSKEKSVEEGNKPRYIFAESIAQQTRDPVAIRAQLMNILLAGRDTTASLLSFLCHHLVRNPEVWARLRAVILEDFGSFDTPHSITFASLKGCTYLQYCINETLRLTTVVPGNSRIALKDTTLPTGGGVKGDKPLFLRKGRVVEYCIHVMQQRPDIWGPDAAEWKPDRWEGRRHGWEYLPFNGGPRICIGQQFAITEASYVMVRLLQKFEKLEAAGDELTRQVTTNLTLTAAPGKGPIVRLKAAKAGE